MKKRVFIVHGWDGSPDEPMHKWLKISLEERGFGVIVPEMPNPEVPEINSWVGKLIEVVKNPDKETYFIGHSIGCQTILRYLERLPEEVKIKGIVLIAPFFDLMGIEDEEGSKEIAKPWLKTQIDYKKVKSHTNNIIAIFSDNDPYVSLSNKELFEERLGAKTIVENNKGHFDPDSGVEDNPTALKELLEIV